MAQDRVGHGLTRQMALWPEQEAPVRIERAKKAGLCPDKAAGQQTDREQKSTQARAAHATCFGVPVNAGNPAAAWAALAWVLSCSRAVCCLAALSGQRPSFLARSMQTGVSCSGQRAICLVRPRPQSI